MSGPLAGLRVVELAGIGPVPHAGMVLADLGADVVLVARPAISDGSRPAGATLRKRRALTLDLKEPAGRDDVLRLTGAADVAGLPPQGDRTQWPAMRERFAATIALRTRDEWTATFEGRDACVTPVLSLDEVEHHPHIAARGTVREVDGRVEVGVAPRFSRTAPGASRDVAAPFDVDAVLAGWR